MFKYATLASQLSRLVGLAVLAASWMLTGCSSTPTQVNTDPSTDPERSVISEVEVVAPAPQTVERRQAKCGHTMARGPSSDAVFAVVDAERSFCRDAASMGVTEAFLKHFSEEGVLFRPDPVLARPWLEAALAQPSPEGTSPSYLYWQPQAAAVSWEGDIGVTWGPWQLESDGTTANYGTYLTVWGRDDAGRLEVLIDHGVSAGVFQWDVYPQALPMGEAAPDGGPLHPALAEIDQRFAADLSDGADAAYGQWLVYGAKVMRDGGVPLSGPFGAQLETAEQWHIDGSVVARSSDLGYVWGRGRDGEGAWTHQFLRVYQRREGGEWGLLADLVTRRGS